MRKRIHLDRRFHHEISFDIGRWLIGVAVFEGGFAVMVGPFAYEYDTVPF